VEFFYDGDYPLEGDAGVTAYANGRLAAVLYRGSGCGQKWVEQYSYRGRANGHTYGLY
jgi:hypothetical protein